MWCALRSPCPEKLRLLALAVMTVGMKRMVIREGRVESGGIFSPCFELEMNGMSLHTPFIDWFRDLFERGSVEVRWEADEDG